MPRSDFAEATRAYHRWLGQHGVALDPVGLARKRDRMLLGKKGKPAGVFPFLRGTFYLWPGQFAAADAPVCDAPRVLSAGDVHLENFGTWRDAEGRLAWGVNDFDEAAELPFTSDLVRLATSLLVARRDKPKDVAIEPAAAAAAILEGYSAGLQAGGRPYVLEREDLAALRRAALGRSGGAGTEKGAKENGGNEAAGPWADWAEEQEEKEGERRRLSPAELYGSGEATALASLLLTALPQGARDPRFFEVHKGLGSLGRRRWTVVADWRGGFVGREAKATASSAVHLGSPGASRTRDHRRLAAEARRVPDPGFLLTESWVVRRVSPEMRKIGLEDLLEEARAAEAQRNLLHAMGGEVANLHAGTADDPSAVAEWLAGRQGPDGGAAWLLAAAEAAAARLLEDHAAFLRDPGVVAERPAPAG